MEGRGEVEEAVHAAYGSVGWSDEWASGDCGVLAAQHVSTRALLQKALERGYLRHALHGVACDVLCASLGVRGAAQTPVFPAVMCRDVSALDWHALAAQRITSLVVLAIVSRETWVRLPLAAGLKVLVEDMATAPLSEVPADSLASALADLDTAERTAVRPLAAFVSAPAETAPHPYIEPLKTAALLGAGASIVPSRTPGRLLVLLPGGARYEIDRYCPHKGADLAGARVEDGHVVCPRHRWRFSLPAGGACTGGKFPCTLNARAVDW